MKFITGMKVQSTEYALRSNIFREIKKGTVVSKRHELKPTIRVMLDGQKYATSYHKDFWEPVSEQAKPDPLKDCVVHWNAGFRP